MSASRLTVLVVGATGSIGRHVVEEALRTGHRVRALVRNRGKLQLPPGVDVVVGDLARQDSLSPALDAIDAIVFTHGSVGGGISGAQAVD